ncbi:MAG: ppdK, partial [Nitrospira sp.]|nr:ppdK [Nitrospira sp.]
EHGGDPSSVEFCHQLGLDYVSCSPYRVAIARLAAAHAALAEADARKAAKATLRKVAERKRSTAMRKKR